MTHIADFLVCVILCSLQGRSDGFPTPRASPCNLQLDDDRSAAQPSGSPTNTRWNIRATSLNYFFPSRRGDSSTSSQQLLPIIGYERISQSSDNDNGGNGIPSSDPLLPQPPPPPPASPDSVLLPPSDFQPAILPPERRPSFEDETGWRRVPHVFQPSSATDNGMGASPSPSPPSSDDRLKISTTSSYAMRLSNFRLSKGEEAPSIMFDENGVMHTNYYPAGRTPQQ